MTVRWIVLFLVVACSGSGSSSSVDSDANPSTDAPPVLPEMCPCPLESYCELATNKCKLGCLVEEDCAAGRYCDVDTRMCRTGCIADGECSTDEICTDHECVPGCRDTSDCAAGNVCSDQMCVEACTVVTCNNPPQPTCVGSNRRTFSSSGTCSSGNCSYPHTDSFCPGGCQFSACTTGWFPLATTGSPSARTGHSAVWTGTDMIVWGGHDLSTFTSQNNGGKFRPSTSAWSSLPTLNAPSPRVFHTAVWTGTEMIVFGGTVGNNLVNDGGRFNPTTGTWTSLPTTNAPAARTGHTAVWTGTEMIVWGGRDNVGFDLATGGRFNPATNTWTSFPAVAGAPGLRSQHTAVWSGTEMIVWGGERSNVLGGPITYLNDGGRYKPSTNSWTALPVLGAPSDRVGHAAVWAGTAGMIVWGGDGSGTEGYLANGGQWRSSGWTLLFEAGAPERRQGHSVVWTGTEMIVWGGYGYNSCCFGGGRFVP